MAKRRINAVCICETSQSTFERYVAETIDFEECSVNCKLIDIKFSTSIDENDIYFSALIIYECDVS